MKQKETSYKKVQYERDQYDWYVEPAWAVECLMDAVTFDGEIYDPACGGGTIPDIMGRRYPTIGTDIVRRWHSQNGTWDFLTSIAMGDYNIVMNPPYKHALAFAQKALELYNRRVAILVSLQFLASQSRFWLFTENPPEQILVLSKRPSMPPGEAVEELGDRAFKGGTTDFCWIIWNNAEPERETRINWVKPNSLQHQGEKQ